ncbi:MAG TPA: CAP domain-containing protein [Candidatus Andersenbacteria bacterium]|nr:CAP domain-containing protein [Candidatus Andersenbacteria bacterium]
MPRLIITLVLLTLAIAAFVVMRPDVPAQLAQLQHISREPHDLLALLEKEISTPPPLRGFLNRPGATLTAAGILQETNNHRAAAGQPTLKSNATLDAAAQNKLDDMFAQQYFEHVSPGGVGPGDVATAAGYQYLRVGENLALGNYPSDADLVQAWMDSPGHRENILSPGFTELGVAAGSGTFEGKTTWLAVQTFGLPASTCPAPRAGLTEQVETDRQAIVKLTSRLDPLRQEFESLAEAGRTKIDAGNREIEEGNRIARQQGSEEEAQEHWDRGEKLQAEGQALLDQARAKQLEYNQLVEQVNSQNDQLKKLIAELNQKIISYNTCVQRVAG